MKKLLLISLIGLLSCSNYEVVDTKVIKGIISYKEEGYASRLIRLPSIYVQDSKSTIKVDIPFANENDFKVGDTVKVIIQQVIKNK